jgi:crossover junction endodeoxyribonuclease RuvC
MITVMGIDPGLADTGWGVLRAEGSRLLHIDHGTITTSADKSTQERLLIIYDAVAEVIERYRPEYAGVENLYFAKNISSALPVAEARGVILLACVRSGVTAHGYSPPEIKQALTGSGNADKQQVQEMVKLMLGLEDIPRPDHAADALAAGICGYHMSSFSGRMQQYLQKGGGA